MARKERNSVDYFPHSVIHGKKMFYIRNKYKNDGYATWFILLEKLGSSEYHYLDLKEEIELMYLSSEIMIEHDLLNKIINDLVSIGEFDSELWENEKILFNQKFIENIQDAYKKRNNECINKESLIQILITKGRSLSLKSNPKQSKGTLKGNRNPQSKVEDSKEDKSKLNVVPEFSVFLNYAIEQKPKVDNHLVKLKYDSWVANDWKDGNNNKIKNWKSKLNNTLPFISEKKNTENNQMNFSNPII